VIGIDFGTTNSCVALLTPQGEVHAVSVENDARIPYNTILRSAVLNPESGRPVIGHEAVARADTRRRSGDRYLVSFKPLLDDQQLRTKLVREVRGGAVYDQLLQCMLDVSRYETVWVGGEFTRDELLSSSRLLLNRLLQAASDAGGDLDQIWMGLPVVFSSCARKRLLRALADATDEKGKPFFAGYQDVLQRVRFVLEPVAVAAAPMRDASSTKERETVLVFDHGGGTLDLCLVEFGSRPGFGHPVPVRQLDAYGSRDVAGRAIDLAFRAYLEQDGAFQRATKGFPSYTVDGLVEERKIALSTRPEIEPGLLGVPTTQADFEAASRPILDRIERIVGESLIRAGLTVTDVDRVFMTGGSSLSPCVQARVEAMFSHLDEYRFLAYDPKSRDDVESALTEIAKGLVSFGDQFAGREIFEQVVLWDVEMSMAGQPSMLPVARRGEPYGSGPDGKPELKRVVPVPPVPGEGTSFGLYEDQLGQRFVFGLADVPPLPSGAQLEVRLRPEELVPRLRLLDPNGDPVCGEPGSRAWKQTAPVQADLMHGLTEMDLAQYFDEDAEYLPVMGYQHFECAPLVRPLRKGDLVEWARDKDGPGEGRAIDRRRGEVLRIRHIDSGEMVDQMSDLELADYVFDIAEKETATLHRVKGRNGSLRLSPRPWKDF
jgi:hypothetical protein